MAGDSGVDSGRDSGVDSREHFREAGVLGGVPAGDSGVSRPETPVFRAETPGSLCQDGPASSAAPCTLVGGCCGSSRGSYLRMHKADRKSTRLNSSHSGESRMPSSA